MSYKIYGLIHPITKKICYVGLTTRTLKERLAQHNNPVKSNPTKIAKLKRSLKEKKFSIILLKDCSSKEDMYNSEITFIKFYRESGLKIYNITDGGEYAKQTPESIRKMLETKKKKGTFPKGLKGEENVTSIFKEEEILFIYSLIKEFYTNEDIISKVEEKFGKSIKRTNLSQIRLGKNWNHLFKEHFTEGIPSLKNFGFNSYNGKVKMRIVELLDKGYPPKSLCRFFKKINLHDMGRISDKKIWKPVWDLHFKLKKRTMLVTM